MVQLYEYIGWRKKPSSILGRKSSYALKTTDGKYVIQFSVNPNRLDLNNFTVGVEDAASGKPASTMQVQLSTTMLDMDMGTDEIGLQSNGHSQYSAQGTLSMPGHWEIRILLRTPDASLHIASVELNTQP